MADMRHQMGVFVFALASLTACMGLPSPAERLQNMQRIRTEARFETITLSPLPMLPMSVFGRMNCAGEPIHIYIEGDGLAWLTPSLPSPDPTPLNPVALKLAAHDTHCNVMYLGRPGQYGLPAAPRYWQEARFAPEVIESYVEAIAAITTASQSLRITGYSGGAAVAALVAARLFTQGREVSLLTVAGNLDTAAWAEGRKFSPLSASLNPADEADTLSHIPQRHAVGRRDKQVPPWVLAKYRSHLSTQRCVVMMEFEADHAGPWEQAQSFLDETPRCEPR